MFTPANLPKGPNYLIAFIALIGIKFYFCPFFVPIFRSFAIFVRPSVVAIVALSSQFPPTFLTPDKANLLFLLLMVWESVRILLSGPTLSTFKDCGNSANHWHFQPKKTQYNDILNLFFDICPFLLKIAKIKFF